MPSCRHATAVLAFSALSSLTAPQLAGQDVTDPRPDERAVVTAGLARFTVLTPHMIRLEWAADGQFEDRPSLVFLNRRLPVPNFRQRSEDGWLVIETDELRLRFLNDGQPFDSANLEIRLLLDGRSVVWRPGTPDTANLGGTIRTLDGVRGPVPLEPGLLSRDGWVLIDDSERPLFDDGEWPWVMARPTGDRRDWYFFGYGHEYTRALGDFTRVAGRIPMPPRFAFGNWWSRYWAYTDQELRELVGEFETFDVPLDVLVIDMDWHETFELRWGRPERDQAGQTLGWTGYTWNETFFPDPEAFLAWTERHGLKTPLNLHPASGIQPHEAQYEAMARAVGIDPNTGAYVPFRIEDQHFARAFFEYVIHPLERQGVDFWWLDWQQWQETSVPGLTPTWWLNYVFFTERERRGTDRPIIFHRFGGLGNHRYQVGFSGDAFSTWEALAFEPYFTATASNVLYGYWSHDIGGHLYGEISPELYTRWIQFGILSPIFRTHTTKNPKAERRIWAYPVEYFQPMRAAIQLRYALVPYIYTAARQAYDTGVPLVRPMYYAHPQEDAAYAFPEQYMFGDDLLASPVVAPMSPDTLLAHKAVWLPEGEWFEWFTGARLAGNRVVERDFAIDEIPLFARAGAIIPMQPKRNRVDEHPVDPLILTLFPGADGSTRVYEDAGNSQTYQAGDVAWTRIVQTRSPHAVRLEVSATEGAYSGMPLQRGYEIRLPGVLPPTRVTQDGRRLPFEPNEGVPGWRYDGDRLMTVVTLPQRPVDRATTVTVELPDDDPSLLDGVPGTLRRLRTAMDILNTVWPDDWSPEALIDLVQTGNRITLDPASAARELTALRDRLPAALELVGGMNGDSATIGRARNHLRSLPSWPANRR